MALTRAQIYAHVKGSPELDELIREYVTAGEPNVPYSTHDGCATLIRTALEKHGRWRISKGRFQKHHVQFTPSTAPPIVCAADSLAFATGRVALLFIESQQPMEN